MDKLDYKNTLKDICAASGFHKKGNAFFRIIGDGVLQVIKSRYERKLGADIISVGLFSMYGYLQPQWLTATGCLPRYDIASCFHQKHLPLCFPIPLQIQLDMLRSRVLPWLDSLDTQKKLVSAITKLDPRWNDSLKIGPYLACGEWNHAKKVLREILAGTDFARLGPQEFYEDASGMLFLKKEQDAHHPQALLEMISREDPAEIDAYLKENYARNLACAKFCIKPTPPCGQ